VPASAIKILVLERDTAVHQSLLRINLGQNTSLEFLHPDTAADPAAGYAAVLGDDSLFEGRDEEPPIARLKQQLGCPVILMTALASPRLARAATAAGAAAVLQKPFSLTDLRKALSTALHRELPPDASGPSTGIQNEHPQLTNGRPAESTQPPSLESVTGRVAPEAVFDQLFLELERRQPLEEGLDAFDIVERHLIRRALTVCGGNQSQAARFLGITRNTLRKRIRKYDFGALLVKDEEPDAE
jgi:DNA-binding NtrC family response regulator